MKRAVVIGDIPEAQRLNGILKSSNKPNKPNYKGGGGCEDTGRRRRWIVLLKLGIIPSFLDPSCLPTNPAMLYFGWRRRQKHDWAPSRILPEWLCDLALRLGNVWDVGF